MKKGILYSGAVVCVVMLGYFLTLAPAATHTASMTATTTGTLTLIKQYQSGSTLECWAIGWTSSDKGNAGGYTDDIHGTIERIVYNPGSAAPTANYDMYLTDQDGVDLLNGTGVNLHTTTTLSTITTEGDGTTNVPMAFTGRATLAVSDAGSTKTGTLRIYVRY